ncbi:acetylcholinesterase-1-like isoform X1 [Dermacentor silvarum]|uniref:acetylcholinesterase-1-like isoform X1 n=1 Tax=Dermacentor silvarum TaxID=543639 RepID=UPI00189C11E8|nr:acetylcholinesterase-1-like isoform X1 [Dermacentor silvarum]
MRSHAGGLPTAMNRLPVVTLLAVTLISAASSHVVNTTCGLVRGIRISVKDKTVFGFLGIPYAQPPTGELRFRKSVPALPWKDVLDATTMPYSCMQPENVFLSAGFEDESRHSEDCLYLNLWTPQTDSPSRPVMVWLHGGAFIMGSASHSYNNGSVIAALGDVVVVAMNYRLGAFGFFTADTEDAPGNMALHDQLLALRWVRDNIRNFGGDPNQVTLFGVSAGAISANLHLLSPLSRGLFKRAILQSGSLYSATFMSSTEEAIRVSNDFASTLGCASSIDEDLLSHPDLVVRCLRSKSADEILRAHIAFSRGKIISMRPVHGDEFMPKSHLVQIERGQFQDGEVLIGTNADEGSLFLFLGFPHLYPLKTTQPVSREDTEKVARILLHALHAPVPDDMFEVYLDAQDSATAISEDERLRGRLIDIVSDLFFVCPSVHFAYTYGRRGNRVFYYSFEHRTESSIWGPWMGVPHSDEVQYVFGMPFRLPAHYTDEEARFSENIMDMWVTFAKTGNPSTQDVRWDEFQRSNGSYLSLRPRRYTTGSHLRQDRCQYWKRHLKYPQLDSAGARALENYPGKVMWFVDNVVSTISKFWTKVKSYGKTFL